MYWNCRQNSGEKWKEFSDKKLTGAFLSNLTESRKPVKEKKSQKKPVEKAK